jgi:UrcA family protein
MKALKILVSFVSAVAIAAAFGAGTAFADDSASTEPRSDVDEHVYAIGKAIKADEVSVTVPFGDLNLDNDKGVAVLYRRLQRAAEYICGVESYSVTRSVRRQAELAACYSTTLTASVDKIDNFTLKQMHQGKEPTAVLAAKVE